MCGDESHEIWTEMLTASFLGTQIEISLFFGFCLYFQVLPQGTHAVKEKNVRTTTP